MEKKCKAILLPAKSQNAKILGTKSPDQKETYNLYKKGQYVNKQIRHLLYDLYVISPEEKIKENTNTFKEGFNGDWFWNSKYNTIAQTGDITSFDFKIIASTDPKITHNISEEFIKKWIDSNCPEEVNVEYGITHTDHTPNGFEEYVVVENKMINCSLSNENSWGGYTG